MVDLDSKTLIGTTERYIVLRDDVLHVEKKYKLTCRVKNEGELRCTHKEVKKAFCIQNGKKGSMRVIWSHAKLQV